jgi:hypothetical protein
MSTPTAKDLLAQADRMMRQRTPEELPVLTDLVIEEIEIPSLTDRMDDVIPTHARPVSAPAAAKPALAPAPAHVPLPVAASVPAKPGPSVSTSAAEPPRAAMPVFPGQALGVAPPVAAPPIPAPPPAAKAQDVFGVRPSMGSDDAAPPSLAAGPNTQTAAASVREQFNAQLLTKLEELQHSVYSQVMQQLELHAAGSLKEHLRTTLEPALVDIARDIAEQVSEDTVTQVRDVLSKSVDAEIARLREQLSKRRS